MAAMEQPDQALDLEVWLLRGRGQPLAEGLCASGGDHVALARASAGLLLVDCGPTEIDQILLLAVEVPLG